MIKSQRHFVCVLLISLLTGCGSSRESKSTDEVGRLPTSRMFFTEEEKQQTLRDLMQIETEVFSFTGGQIEPSFEISVNDGAPTTYKLLRVPFDRDMSDGRTGAVEQVGGTITFAWKQEPERIQLDYYINTNLGSRFQSGLSVPVVSETNEKLLNRSISGISASLQWENVPLEKDEILASKTFFYTKRSLRLEPGKSWNEDDGQKVIVKLKAKFVDRSHSGDVSK